MYRSIMFSYSTNSDIFVSFIFLYQCEIILFISGDMHNILVKSSNRPHAFLPNF